MPVIYMTGTHGDEWASKGVPNSILLAKPFAPEGERGDRTDTRDGHKSANLRIMASQFHNLAVKLTDLLLDGSARFEQRPDRSYQLRTPLDQLFSSHGKDIELGTADDKTEVLQQAPNMVLEIALDLDQQRPAGQKRPDRVTVDILDVHLLEPAGLHDTSDPDSIVAVAFVDLHLEHRLGMARVNADHWQAKSLKLSPKSR